MSSSRCPRGEHKNSTSNCYLLPSRFVDSEAKSGADGACVRSRVVPGALSLLRDGESAAASTTEPSNPARSDTCAAAASSDVPADGDAGSRAGVAGTAAGVDAAAGGLLGGTAAAGAASATSAGSSMDGSSRPSAARRSR